MGVDGVQELCTKTHALEGGQYKLKIDNEKFKEKTLFKITICAILGLFLLTSLP